MKKSIIYSSVLVLLLVIGWACSSSFLDEEPRGFLSATTLANKNGVEASLIGAYAMLDGYNIEGQDVWGANPHNWILGSITTDDAYKGSERTDMPENTQLEIYQWSAGNIRLDERWVALYEGVARVNNTIRLLNDATDIGEADRKRIEGEARFLRAYYHFELYKVWGNVAYFTEADEDR